MRAFLRRHWRALLGMAITGIAVVVLALPLTLGAYYGGKLGRAIDALRAAGHPVEAADFRKGDVADGENRAVALMELAGRVPEWDYCHPANRWPDRAILEAGVLISALPGDEVNAALARPKVRWPTRIPGALGDPETYVNALRQLADALADDGALAASRGDSALAAERMRQLLDLSASTGEDATLIGWLVSVGIEAMACEDVGRHLLDPTDEQAAPLIARLLDDAGENRRLSAALDVDRATQVAFCRSLAGAGVKGFFAGPYMNSTATSVLRLADLQYAMMTDETRAGRQVASAELARIAGNKYQPLVSIMAPAAMRQEELALRHRAERRLFAALLACRAFRHDHGRLPGSLEELVPKYLPTVPADPYASDGLKLRYDAAKGLLYTLGVNATDEGGQIVPPKPKNPEYAPEPWDAKDVGFDLSAEVTSPRRR